MTRKADKAPVKKTARGRLPKDSNSKQDILNAALELFAKSGFDSVTIRDIEQKSGVNAPTLYHYFGDKRALYDEAVKTAFEQIASEVFADFDSSKDAKEIFYGLVMRYIEVFSRTNVFTRIFLQELHQEDDALKLNLAQDVYVPAYKRWQFLLNEIRPGVGDGSVPVILVSALLGLGAIASIRKLAPPMPANANSLQEQEEIARLLLDFVLNYPVPGKEAEHTKRRKTAR